MEFNSMRRKELQALCKKHKIPANLSNSEMADRLTTLLTAKEKVLTLGKSCMKSLDENGSENESDIENRRVKKVRFSPDNQMFEFEKSETKFSELKGRGRQKLVINKGNVVESISAVVERKGGKRSIKGEVLEKNLPSSVDNVVSENVDNAEHRVVARRSLRNRKVVDEKKREIEDVEKGWKKNVKGRIVRQVNVEGTEDVAVCVQPEIVQRRSKRNVARMVGCKILHVDVSKSEVEVGKGRSRRTIAMVENEDSGVDNDAQILGKEGSVAGEKMRRSKRNAFRHEPSMISDDFISDADDKRETRKRQRDPVLEEAVEIDTNHVERPLRKSSRRANRREKAAPAVTGEIFVQKENTLRRSLRIANTSGEVAPEAVEGKVAQKEKNLRRPLRNANRNEKAAPEVIEGKVAHKEKRRSRISNLEAEDSFANDLISKELPSRRSLHNANTSVRAAPAVVGGKVAKKEKRRSKKPNVEAEDAFLDDLTTKPPFSLYVELCIIEASQSIIPPNLYRSEVSVDDFQNKRMISEKNFNRKSSPKMHDSLVDVTGEIIAMEKVSGLELVQSCTSESADLQNDIIQPELETSVCKSKFNAKDVNITQESNRTKSEEYCVSDSHMEEEAHFPGGTRVSTCSGIAVLESVQDSSVGGDEISSEKLSFANCRVPINQPDSIAEPERTQIGDELSPGEQTRPRLASSDQVVEDERFSIEKRQERLGQEGLETRYDDASENHGNASISNLSEGDGVTSDRRVYACLEDPVNSEDAIKEMISGADDFIHAPQLLYNEEHTSVMELEQRVVSPSMERNSYEEAAETDMNCDQQELESDDLSKPDEDRPLEEKCGGYESENAAETDTNVDLQELKCDDLTNPDEDRPLEEKRGGYESENAAETDTNVDQQDLKCEDLTNPNEDRPLEEKYECSKKCHESFFPDPARTSATNMLLDGIVNVVEDSPADELYKPDKGRSFKKYDGFEKCWESISRTSATNMLQDGNVNVCEDSPANDLLEPNEAGCFEKMYDSSEKSRESIVPDPARTSTTNMLQDGKVDVAEVSAEPAVDLTKPDEAIMLEEKCDSSKKCWASPVPDPARKSVTNKLQDGKVNVGEDSAEPADFLGTFSLTPYLTAKTMERECMGIEFSASISGFRSTVESNLTLEGPELQADSHTTVTSGHSPSNNNARKEDIADLLDLKKDLELGKESPSIHKNVVKADDVAEAENKFEDFKNFEELMLCDEKDNASNKFRQSNVFEASGSNLDKLEDQDFNNGRDFVDVADFRDVAVAYQDFAGHITEASGYSAESFHPPPAYNGAQKQGLTAGSVTEGTASEGGFVPGSKATIERGSRESCIGDGSTPINSAVCNADETKGDCCTLVALEAPVMGTPGCHITHDVNDPLMESDLNMQGELVNLFVTSVSVSRTNTEEMQFPSQEAEIQSDVMSVQKNDSMAKDGHSYQSREVLSREEQELSSHNNSANAAISVENCISKVGNGSPGHPQKLIEGKKLDLQNSDAWNTLLDISEETPDEHKTCDSWHVAGHERNVSKELDTRALKKSSTDDSNLEQCEEAKTDDLNIELEVDGSEQNQLESGAEAHMFSSLELNLLISEDEGHNNLTFDSTKDAEERETSASTLFASQLTMPDIHAEELVAELDIQVLVDLQSSTSKPYQKSKESDVADTMKEYNDTESSDKVSSSINCTDACLSVDMRAKATEMMTLVELEAENAEETVDEAGRKSNPSVERENDEEEEQATNLAETPSGLFVETTGQSLENLNGEVSNFQPRKSGSEAMFSSSEAKSLSGEEDKLRVKKDNLAAVSFGAEIARQGIVSEDNVAELNIQYIAASETKESDVADSSKLCIDLLSAENLSLSIDDTGDTLHVDMFTKVAETIALVESEAEETFDAPDRNYKPSVGGQHGEVKEEPTDLAETGVKLSPEIADQSLANVDGALEDAWISQRKTDSLQSKELDTLADESISSPVKQQLQSAVRKKRTVLIHGTPNKLQIAADMKENMPSSKIENLGTLTTVRQAAKRPALKDLLPK